jgi:hypothetical protein
MCHIIKERKDGVRREKREKSREKEEGLKG